MIMKIILDMKLAIRTNVGYLKHGVSPVEALYHSAGGGRDQD